ncbi:hypothetical protein BABINDRAFT_14570 [Babjeviella inositovora NRRL Y-12698]|uniref:Major facilitator superfamily (MFS) profile domain-containing protein n=1 Tax=Babjeviella inositovora NRRL Y-12698 TaxID=984486 RepID=A0A1E3QN32_9ASCO|nr:uncharacterized protein BABINDRAFT_14570 [Babjeviella inositovora NRRL Y-12698]ODQ78397.1 hypothetical protein BABINDRAFT_14570 [Babjeviella inositovora NRRL Y-12698]
MFNYGIPQQFKVESHFRGNALVKSVVALSIFFFGYDRGVMAGINRSPDYVRVMELGYANEDGSITVTNSSKGAFISVEFTLNIFGIVVAYWVEYGLSYINGSGSAIRWRLPIVLQIVPLLVLISIVWFFSESPRWFVKNNENDLARELLMNMRGNDTGVQMITGIFKYDTPEEKEKLDRLHIPRRIWLCIIIQVVQEWTAIASIAVYLPKIFAQARFGPRKAAWLSGLNIFYMFSTLVSVFTIDRFGRRFTCYWGAVGQGFSMFLAGGFSLLQQANPDSKSYGAATASLVTQGNAFSVASWSIGSGWLTLLSPVMFDNIAEKTLYLFRGCKLAAIPMIYFIYPETANRTLEEID